MLAATRPRGWVGNRMNVRILLRAVCLALAFAAAGCTNIPGAGPRESLITEKTADLSGFTLIEMTAEKVADYRVVRAADQAGSPGIPQAPRIRLASGDILKVRIAESKEGGLFAPLAVGGTPFEKVQVDNKGTITLPYAGRVKVAGLDPPQVAELLRAKLSGVTFEPQVFVELVSGRATSVLVSGEVRNPGRFSMLDGPMTLIDAINKTGGATQPPHQIDVVVRRGGKVARLPLSTVQSGSNQELQPGDEVILESNLKFFNALGATSKTGQVEFASPNPTLLDSLSQVGGLNPNMASTRGVFVFRLMEPRAFRDGAGSWQAGAVIFKFDMSKPETLFLAQAFGIKPRDTIYVTTAPSVEWIKALAPIAQTLSIVRNGVALESQVQNLD